MNKILVLAILVAAGGLAMVAVLTQSAASATNMGSSVVSGTALGRETSSAGTITPPFARDAAIGYVRGLTLVARRVDSIEAKLTTWGQWATANSQSESVAGVEPQRLIWVVGVTGNVELPVNHGMTVAWGAILLDATTGKPLGATGGKQPPDFYRTLIDLAPH